MPQSQPVTQNQDELPHKLRKHEPPGEMLPPGGEGLSLSPPGIYLPFWLLEVVSGNLSLKTSVSAAQRLSASRRKADSMLSTAYTIS